MEHGGWGKKEEGEHVNEQFNMRPKRPGYFSPAHRAGYQAPLHNYALKGHYSLSSLTPKDCLPGRSFLRRPED